MISAQRFFRLIFARIRSAGSILVAGALVIVSGASLAEHLQPQVEVEVRFVNVSDNFLKDIGVDFKNALGKLEPDATQLAAPENSNLALGPKPSADNIATKLFPETQPGSLSLSAILTDGEFTTIVNAIRKEKKTEIIAAPEVTIPGNQPAIINLTGDNGGIILKVTPDISPDRRSIGLTILPEIGNLPQPESQIKVSSGKVPGNCDIPVLGGLVRSKTASQKPEHLVIFIQPRLVNVLEGEDGGGGGGGDPVDVEITGTGETIGHVADLKVQNRTNESQILIVPPVILESVSQKNQDYVCPGQQEVALKPQETKIIPMDGVCINRDKPPVGKGVTGDLVINTGNPTIPTKCHHSRKKARDLINLCEAKYRCVEKLQKDGELKNFPYRDKKEQKEILIQWSTWNDSRISEITGSPPATQDDLKQVVYKQAETKGSVPRDTKKKLDEGIDTIFEKVELTNERAKELEKPDPFEGVELTGQKAKDDKSPNNLPPP